MAPSLATLTSALITSRLRFTVILSLVLALISLASLFGHWIEPTASAAATTITVTNTNDSGPGSLKFAIVQANFNRGADTINFDLGPGAHTITLLSALSDIVDDVTITGPGSNLLTIQRSTASGTPNFRIFYTNGHVLNISGMIITNGKTPDGAPNSTFSGGGGGDGGGISSTGTLTLTDVVVTGNTTGNGGDSGSSTGGFGGFGGGISSFGTLTMTNVVVSNNTTGNGATGSYGGSGGRGGGLAFGGNVLTMTNCNVTDNVTGTGANGTNGGLSGGSGGDGAGLYISSGTLNLANVIVNGNRVGDGAGFGSTGGSGGGIFTYPGVTSTLVNCAVTNNSSGQGGSGFGTQGGNGGGIINLGPMNMAGCTISGNSNKGPSISGGASGGGIFNDNVLTMTNCTISGNRTDLNIGRGGGIYHNGSTLTLTNCTVTGNLGGNSSFEPGWGIHSGRTTNISNSIVADNGSGNSFDVSGTFTSQGHNLISKSDGSNGFTNGVNGDQVGTSASPLNPLLAPLANYGGLTQTHALLPGSPAIDAGTSNGAPAQDQRGVNRDAAVDIGSFESQAFIATTSGTPQSTTIYTTFATVLQATVRDSSGNLVSGVTVTFTAPASGASGTFANGTTTTTSITNASGVATATAFTANSTAGSYNIAASTSGVATSTDFALANLQATTSTLVTSSANPSNFGQSVTFTATESGAGGPPTGTVTFFDGATNLGTTNLSGSVATFATSTLSVGQHSITAAYNGDTNYKPSTSNALTQIVNKATATVTLSDLSQTYDGRAKRPSATTSPAFLNVTFTYTQNNQNVAAPINAGSYNVTATVNDLNYQGSATGTLVISKATPTVNVRGGTYTYDGNPHPATGTVLGVNSEYLVTPTFTYNGSSTVPVNVGTYTVVGSFAGNSNYNATSSSPVQLVISKGTPTITWSNPPDITYGTALDNAQLNATANVPGNFVYTPPNGTQLAAGTGQTVSVTFTPTDTAHYQSTSKSVSLNVLKATPTINVTGGTYTYDNSPHSASGSILGVNNENLGTPTFTYNGSSTVPINVGTYTVAGSFAGNSNYNSAVSSNAVQLVIAEAPKLIQFSERNYNVLENAGGTTITVSRSGNTSEAASIDYLTSDGTARQRSDYTLASGTLLFAPGEASKTFPVLVIDNAYVDGSRTVNLTLSNPIGAGLGSLSTAILTIQDNDTVAPTTNPVDDARFFVRMQYLDFLNREPDTGGFDYWSSLITSCNGDPQCINVRRVSVSAAFFIEQEFQLTGNYVYRMYKAAYGQRPSYAQFLPDRARINPDVAQIEASKQQFADLFVQRPEFLARYPSTMTPDAFIDALIATVKTETGGAIDLTSQRAALLSTLQASGRATVVRQAAENTAFQSAEYNKAFVTMQYFGYLRRDPEDGGYNFWLDVLNNRVANNYRGMVCAFITSAEYQDRFSSVITRDDKVCGSIGP